VPILCSYHGLSHVWWCPLPGCARRPLAVRRVPWPQRRRRSGEHGLAPRRGGVQSRRWTKVFKAMTMRTVPLCEAPGLLAGALTDSLASRQPLWPSSCLAVMRPLPRMGMPGQGAMSATGTTGRRRGQRGRLLWSWPCAGMPCSQRVKTPRIIGTCCQQEGASGGREHRIIERGLDA
jgi:hypothetical protein